MNIILGHQNLDFDCLASMVAAKKLHPEAKIYLQPTAEGGVLEFLNLYRDHFSFFRYSEYRQPSLGKVIVVDTNKTGRLGPYREAVERADEIILYDHHPLSQGDIETDERLFGEAGALITLLVDRLRGASLNVTPFEATLFMLGLHQETGGLQFGTTAPLDYDIGKFLLKSGADLDLVQNFCHRQLTDQQLDLFNELLKRSENLTLNNVPVTIATAERDKYIPEVALLAHKLRDTENTNLLCLLVRMNKKVQVVIRNRYRHVDAGVLARQFGGGGHQRAASATLSGVTISEARESLVELLCSQLKPELTARQIMSTPVHSIRSDLSVKKAQKIMLELGHHGLPITDAEDNLKGIITRSDVDKAVEHDLTHAPVKGFMIPDVVTISLDTGLQQIQNCMMENQIGRLPVTDDSKLVGIVTRTDLIRVLHERYRPGQVKEIAPAYSRDIETDNVKPLLRQVLSKKQLNRLRKWGNICEELGDRLYLVGGSVRDILTEESTRDFDFVVREDALEFAREIADREGAKLTEHEKFRTASFKLAEGLVIDVATARSEFYSHPAALPRVNVEQASIYQDLRRRDFTINSMAIDLSPGNFGDLLDLYSGRQDLEKGEIRVHDRMSFLDDPTRIFRAIRFATRFDFELESNTKFQLEQALKGNPFGAVSGDRLQDELGQVFAEPNPWKVVKKLFDFGVLQSLVKELKPVDSMGKWFGEVPRLLKNKTVEDKVAIYYCLLTYPLSQEKSAYFAKRLMFSQRREDIINQFKRGVELASEIAAVNLDSELNNLLDFIDSVEVLLALQIATEESVRRKIKHYRQSIRSASPLVSGVDLKEWGVEPGPEMGNIIEEIYAYQLDADIESKDKLREYFEKEIEVGRTENGT